MEKEAADHMEKIAREAFAPVYPLLAEQICSKELMHNDGVCIDIGCGGAQLGIEIGKRNKCQVIAYDKNPFALEYAEKNAVNEKLKDRFSAICGDVEQIPLEDESVDLCVSRGSMWFWKDGGKAFKEIYRILKRGANAYVGCGFGTEQMLETVVEQMKETDPEWNEKRKQLFLNNPVSKFQGFLTEAGIKDYMINEDAAGRWIIVTK